MKILIIEACTLAGEATSIHADVGSEHDVPKDEAILLARMGRALLVDKADDPTKGSLTASAEDKADLKKRVQAIKADREARELAAAAQSPAGLSAIVAQAVAAAVQAALAKPAA
jgi:hypothetical protein